MASQDKEPLTFRAADEVKQIAKGLIGVYHKHLKGKEITYLFRSEPESVGGKTALGTARKVSGLNAFLAGSSVENLGALTDSGPGEEPKPFFLMQVWEFGWNQHIWMWLTKRAGRLAEFDFWLHSKDIKWPDNLWGGTSVTSAASARRVIDLAGTRIATLFVSGEPQKEFIDPASIVGRDRISLWIQGGASGIGAERFDVQWARAWRDWCRATGANYFLKQLGAHATYAGNRMPLSHSHGGDWNEWPHDLRVRQFPGVRTL